MLMQICSDDITEDVCNRSPEIQTWCCFYRL